VVRRVMPQRRTSGAHGTQMGGVQTWPQYFGGALSVPFSVEWRAKLASTRSVRKSDFKKNWMPS